MVANPFLVVMGVSGSGKTTVGRLVADRLGVAFIDGDDLHSAANVASMAAGTPLTDDDRRPWIDDVGRAGAAAAREGGVVVACSALRRAHRDLLRQHGADHVAHLTAPAEVLRQRLSVRAGHFMRADMLQGQLHTLEDPAGEGDVMVLDVADLEPAEAADQIARVVLAGRQPPGRHPGWPKSPAG